MDISVKGKQVDVGDALRGHAESNLVDTVTKYFDSALDSNVVFSREGNDFRADISVHAGRGMVMQGRASANDAYAAFDNALERIAKRLRRYKKRIRDHRKGDAGDEIIAAQYAVIASESDGETVLEDAHPTIIAEMAHEIATLTVGEAVMRLDLADIPALMFRNRAHDVLNVVYRRADGNVGWIDPYNSQDSK